MTNAIFYFYTYSIFVPIILGLWKWKKLDTSLRVILVLLLFGAFFEFFNQHLSRVYRNNIGGINVYHLVELAFIGIYFYTVTAKSWLRKTTFAAFSLLLLWSAVYIFIIKGIHSWNALVFGVGSLVFIVFSLLHLMEIIQKIQYVKIETIPQFWISGGILLSFILGITMYSVYHFNIVLSDVIYHIFTLARVLFYLSISIGFYVVGKKDATLSEK